MPPLSEREKHPELFIPDSNIDRRTCKRVVPMQVLSLGMSRTGTNCTCSHHHHHLNPQHRTLATLPLLRPQQS